MRRLALLAIAAISAAAQSAFTPPRLPDGHPDLGGIWMAGTLSAAFNVEEHEASYGTPAGPFHSNTLHVVERYTRTAANTLRYEATIEDLEVFERPWSIRMNLARHTEPNFQLIEHECERDAQGVYRHPPQFLKDEAR